tara:strand:+ start:158 stop:496 length:339 start_codon:yes stop_codon:yes gene_type:complete
MKTIRIKTEIWIKAHLRVCDRNLLPAVIRRRGDPDAGSILIKLDRLDGTCVILTRCQTVDGEQAWVKAFGKLTSLDIDGEAYIAKQIALDPDIWLLEIEDPNAKYEIDGVLI